MDIPEAQDLEPPSSQVTSHVFVNLANQSLKVFVEASQVVNRPKLVRRLRSGGATICDQVTEAEIIVVDPETDSGIQLIQDWGAEKTVLDSSWVQKSIERGQAFLAAEGWGGLSTAVVNGSSGASGSSQNHLPTPRETPLEPKAPQDEPLMQNHNPLVPPPTLYTQGLSPPPGTPFQQQQMPPPMPTGQPVGAMPINAVLQNYSNAQVTLPAQLVAQMMAYINQQQGMSPTNVGMSQMSQMPQMPQMPANMLQGQAFPSGFPQQSMPFMPSPSMFAQAPFQHPQAGAFPSQMSSTPFVDAGSSMHSSDSQTSTSPDVVQRNGSISELRRYSPMDLEDHANLPSQKRKKRPAHASTTSTSEKSKSREDARPPKHRRMSKLYAESIVPLADASPSSSQPHHGLSDSVEKLFVKESGDAYRFFVQVEIRNRSKIADAIKKNGGRMEPNISDADFVILGHPTTKNFEEWLRQSGYFGKVPVKPQWVLQCVEQNQILELDEYAYEGFKVEKKRGRLSSTGQRYVVTATGLKQEGHLEPEHEREEASGMHAAQNGREATKEAAVKKPKKEKTEKKAHHKSSAGDDIGNSASKAKAKAKTLSMSPKSHWEPSPPPPTRVVEHMSGRNLYTKEDLDYCDEYIPVLLNRDSKMTTAAICEKLHAKMPHHTFKSWQTHIQSTPARREKLVLWRRRADIASRKADADTGQFGSEDHGELTTQAVVAPHMNPQAALGDPFAVMTDFFANGRADTLEDADVWQVLAREYPELSAQDWEKYWIDNNEAIAQAVSHRTGSQGGASAADASGLGRPTKIE